LEENALYDEENTFRDTISTIDKEGKRIWVFPKKPSGWFFDKRKTFSYALLLALFAGPYIKIGGEPFLLMNILERKFVIFGQIFWPQDMHLFALAMIIFVLFVALFTVVFGRLFCGWVCPQTIFMEMVFRRIEYWIEGDWKAQERLAKSDWTKDKIKKAIFKHSIFWTISFLIANTFLAYIIGYEQLFTIITDNPLKHIIGIISIVVFTTIFYLVFSRLREQVCTTICPYGRLQSVMLDSKSLVVAYDYVRGEDRGKFKKNEDREATTKGDCIDCFKCVHVCPTGIDIRNGTQLECINCTACIDACDDVMDKVGLDKGLIRLDSIEGIENKSGFLFTTRVKGYIAVLIILMSIMVGLLVSRSDFDATILRTRGTLFQKVESGVYSNLYDISVLNKTNKDLPIEIKLLDNKGQLKIIGDEIILKAQSEAQTKFMILMNDQEYGKRKTKVSIGLFSNGEMIQEITTNFISPSL
jgi:cytochrome c oxidase accessory protein FixG